MALVLFDVAATVLDPGISSPTDTAGPTLLNAVVILALLDTAATLALHDCDARSVRHDCYDIFCEEH